MRQVAGQRGGERASRAMGGIRALTVRLENFCFRAPAGGEAEEIDGLVEVTAGDHHIRRSQASAGESAASRIWSRFVTAIPVRTLASSRFGVMISASGSSLSIKSRVPAASSKSAPELDFRIGSSTTCGSWLFPSLRKSATTSTTCAFPSIPMWTASTAMSETSSCKVSAMIFGIDALDPPHALRRLDGQGVMQATP